MNWIVLSVLSAVTGSLTRILQKVLLKDEQSNTFAFGFIFQLLVAGLFLIYTLVTGTLEFPALTGLILNLIIMTLFYSIGNLFTFYAFKNADASEVSIILASNTVWSVISAILFLGERIKLLNVMGVILIVLSIVAINYSKTKWKLNKGHLYGALGAMLFGIAFTNDAYIINRYESVASYMILAFGMPGLATIFYSPKSIRRLGHFFTKRIFLNLLLCGIFYALSAIFIFTAYKNGGQASLISPIQQTSIIFTVALSWLFLGERKKMINKLIGMFLSFAGVLLLIS